MSRDFTYCKKLSNLMFFQSIGIFSETNSRNYSLIHHSAPFSTRINS